LAWPAGMCRAKSCRWEQERPGGCFQTDWARQGTIADGNPRRDDALPPFPSPFAPLVDAWPRRDVSISRRARCDKPEDVSARDLIRQRAMTKTGTGARARAGDRAYHAIDPLAGLGKDEFLDAPFTCPARKAVSMIALVARHDGFFRDCLLAHKALGGVSMMRNLNELRVHERPYLVRAVSTHRTTVRQEQEIGVRRDAVLAFCAAEAVNVP
jgi:hypothetical protein